jgi:hypothetical protein
MSHLFDNFFPSTDASGTNFCYDCCSGRGIVQGNTFGTRSYRSRVDSVVRDSAERIKQSVDCWRQLRSLRSRSDEDEVCATLYKFIFSNFCEATSAKDVVQTALSFCYLKERLGALELVIWKVMCMVQVPPCAVTDLHAWIAWCRLGWKIHKGGVRHGSSLAIVMSSVIPFVDQSEEIAHYPTIQQVSDSDTAPQRTLEKTNFQPLDHLCLDLCSAAARNRDACTACTSWVRKNIINDDGPDPLCLACCTGISCKVCAQWADWADYRDTTEYGKVEYLVGSCSIFRRRIQESSEYWPLVRQIHSGRDQTKALAAQFRFLFGNLCEEERIKADMVCFISKCIIKECLTVLTLAVWKALCTMRAPRDVRDIYAWNLWCSEGWKVHKADVRSTREVRTILSFVSPFAQEIAIEASGAGMLNALLGCFHGAQAKTTA